MIPYFRLTFSVGFFGLILIGLLGLVMGLTLGILAGAGACPRLR